MIELLIKDEILTSLDFFYFNICIKYIKGKYTTVKKKNALRVTKLM